MPRRHLVFIALVAACTAAVVSTRFGPSDSGPLDGSIIGIDADTGPAPKLEDPIQTPSGRWVVPGSIDEKGYTLPLDVKRPRPPRPLPPRPTSEEIAARRADAPRGIFTEVRLGPDDGHTQNETSIDAEGSTIVCGYNSFTNSSLVMGYSRSTDGGENWTDGVLGGGHTLTSDPVVKSGNNGKWYYCYLGSPGPGGSDIDIYVSRSTDSGLTWGTPTTVSTNTAFDDKPYMDARGDEVLVAWADFGSSPTKITVASSTDGGQTFGTNKVVSTNAGSGNGACPVIDDFGNYYVFWRDSFQESLWVAKSTDLGVTWAEDFGIVAMDPLPTPQPGGYRLVNLPSAASDPVTGDLVVVWNDEVFGDGDIASVRSTDFGATWSSPTRVNDDVGSEVQFFPWIDFDPNGVAHIVWYDRRENGFDIDVYMTKSFDQGQTFEPNVRVTAAPFSPILPSEGGAASFIGDYNGISATADQIYPFYQDSREGNQDVYVALVSQSTADVDSETGSAFRAGAIRAIPSPFTDHVSLRLPAGSGQVEIVTVEGRIVRQMQTPTGNAEWDGRDNSGRLLPAGVYFARIPGLPNAGTRLVKRD